ncbi:MAG: EAL domain-containing protein [Allosphingosinicella sp.]
MLAASVSESELLTELQLAVERDELSLLYQPKVTLADNRLVGVEALARWPHRTLGLICPSAFVPIAERYGLIDELTDWLLRRGLKQWAIWAEQGVRTNIAFNVSALSLRDVYFPDYLHRLCQVEGVPAHAVTIEVTEGATQHIVRLLDTLTRFRLKGMGLALDDFGTGYSSLLQLRQLPYTELKVDRCFVSEAVRSRESRLIVKAVIDLAHGLGLAATAEGVEDSDTLALLAELGCDHAQGFFIASPMEGWQLVPWLMGGEGEGVVPIAAARAGSKRGAAAA